MEALLFALSCVNHSLQNYPHTVIPEIFALLIFARLIFAVIYYSLFQEPAKKETSKTNRRAQSVEVRVSRALT